MSQERRRLLYLVTRAVHGGAQTHVLDLAAALRDRFEIAIGQTAAKLQRCLRFLTRRSTFSCFPLIRERPGRIFARASRVDTQPPIADNVRA